MKQTENEKNSKGKIFWIDDEIELLKPHILFLQEKGYEVFTSNNGEDAILMTQKNNFDLIFLDEMMPGIGGLQVLALIKKIKNQIPVILVTKNEAETLMEEAIGDNISDYLIKPVSPSQILLTTKKFLEGNKIKSEHLQYDYVKEFTEISSSISFGLNTDEWIKLYLHLMERAIDFDEHSELSDLKITLQNQFREANSEFGKFVERNYKKWINEERNNRPTLSVDIVDKFLIPEIQNKKSVFFFVIDCMRYDQWLMFETLLYEYFEIEKNFYFSILPTATPYSRNAIFSGSFPDEIEKRHPEIWAKWEDDENSLNKFEKELLDKLLERRRLKLEKEAKYIKILDANFGKNIEQNILSHTKNNLTSIVINFVDMLAHGRSESTILKEIAPNESAYRLLTKTWFQHSSFFAMLKSLSKEKNVSILVTTDHGSIRSLRDAKVIADKTTSASLRYKVGKNLKCEDKFCVNIKDPSEYKLPKRGPLSTYIIAKEDYYFVYPTEYNYYAAHYRDTFQHGGISMEEMILPVIKLTPKI